MFFFFNDTATTEIYTLSLHDALPISRPGTAAARRRRRRGWLRLWTWGRVRRIVSGIERVTRRRCRLLPAAHLEHLRRSEEHTSELQSRQYLVCRLLLEKKNTYSHTYV